MNTPEARNEREEIAARFLAVRREITDLSLLLYKTKIGSHLGQRLGMALVSVENAEDDWRREVEK